MGIFKSEERKVKDEKEKIKKNWRKTSEYELGVSYEEYIHIHKDFQKGLVDAVRDDGRISDADVINAIFPNLSPEQKVLILYYGRWVDDVRLKAEPF